jgi:hypothetical protein
VAETLSAIITRLEKASIPPVNPRKIQEIVIDLRKYERESESEEFFEIVPTVSPSRYLFPM